MADFKYNDQINRDAILNLLTDGEVAKVSNIETGSSLQEGDEYLDLEHLDHGIQKAKRGREIAMATVVPRSIISAESWKKIIAQFAR